METECGFFSVDNSIWQAQVELEEPGVGNRLNDGRCDRRGRYWAGSMFEDVFAREFTGLRHRVDGPTQVVTDRTGVGVSNGLAFSPDGETMYWADSFHRTVWRYDFGMTTLFITSIGAPGSTPHAPGQPEAGKLMAIETGFDGLPEPRLRWGCEESG